MPSPTRRMLGERPTHPPPPASQPSRSLQPAPSSELAHRQGDCPSVHRRPAARWPGRALRDWTALTYLLRGGLAHPPPPPCPSGGPRGSAVRRSPGPASQTRTHWWCGPLSPPGAARCLGRRRGFRGRGGRGGTAHGMRPNTQRGAPSKKTLSIQDPGWKPADWALPPPRQGPTAEIVPRPLRAPQG